MTSIIFHCHAFRIVPIEQLSLKLCLKEMIDNYGFSWLDELEAITYRQWYILLTVSDKENFQHTSPRQAVKLLYTLIRKKIHSEELLVSSEWCDSFPRFAQ